MYMKRTKVIAFYLPQYYPTPENDKWWGVGFTEWTNVGKAKPLFSGHYQPKVPADLGYYDLRVPETRQAQADLAAAYGIDGFCYWHYWFAGRRLLDRPFKEVLESGSPEFPFCLCWANHSWQKGTWSENGGSQMLVEQTYPGKQDVIDHFMALLPAFRDKRYIRINNQLLFGLYSPLDVPDFLEFSSLWNELAEKNGLGKFHFFGFTMRPEQSKAIVEHGFDSSVVDYVFSGRPDSFSIFDRLNRRFFHKPFICDYAKYSKTIRDDYSPSPQNQLCIIPNFDHSPRSGHIGVIYNNATPEAWGKLLDYVVNEMGYDEDILFIKAWNEWGEGNYLEPDLKYGRGYLEELKRVLM